MYYMTERINVAPLRPSDNQSSGALSALRTRPATEAAAESTGLILFYED
jgi:hypothetical protein